MLGHKYSIRNVGQLVELKIPEGKEKERERKAQILHAETKNEYKKDENCFCSDL